MESLNSVKYSGVKTPFRSDLRGREPVRINTSAKKPSKPKKTFNVATWNIRTLSDSPTAKHPERRTALIAHELHRLNVDIAALTETRFTNEGSLTEKAYTFFWKGHPTNKIHGVGFAIKNTITKKLGQIPLGITERLMTLRYPIMDNTFINFICAYAPTLKDSTEAKEQFYQQLEEVLIKIPKNERIVLLGDFNARVGKQADLWPGVIGKHGIGNVNNNGELLLSKCTEHDLTITNTCFRLKDKFKGTWKHPRSGHWHQLDHIIVRKKNLKDIKISKARADVECWSDHRLVLCKMAVMMKPKSRRLNKQEPKPRLNLNKLNSPDTVEDLNNQIRSQLLQANCGDDVEANWQFLRNTIVSASTDVLGVTSMKRNQNWFDDNDLVIKNLLDEKQRAHQAVICNPKNINAIKKFNSINHKVRKELRLLKNQWWSQKASEIQSYADLHDSRNFYQALKTVYGPSSRTLCPIKNSEGDLLRDESQILHQWKKHYHSILNLNSEVDDSVFNIIPKYSTAEDIDAKITSEEIQVAIRQLKNNKASGCDHIPGEIYKALSGELLQHLEKLFNLIWDKGYAPQDFRDATITNIFKNKGSPSECGNYRGISLLAVGGKILTKIMSNRLLPLLEKILPDTQCGFRPNRGTIDLIFSFRQIQEKVKEHQTRMFAAFIDLTKAFDCVNRNALWSIMERFGVPPKFLSVCKSLHENNWAMVKYNNKLSEPFQTHTGVRQGCVLAPLLFNIFSAALTIIVDNRLEERGIALRYRFDGGLFNTQRLKAKTRVRYITDMQYADDCALLAESAEQLQAILDCYSYVYKALGLQININKTKILTVPHANHHQDVYVENNPVDYVTHFNYLGSIMNDKANIDDEIQNRISAASRAFWKLKTRVFYNHDLNLQTKFAVYRAVIIPTMLYGCETWVTYRRHLKALEQLQQRHLRQIMRIRWYHYVSNIKILERANCFSIETLVNQACLRWMGHISRMHDNRLPRCVLYGELVAGKRKQGGQRKRYKDVLHNTFKQLGIQKNWEELAADRQEWRQISSKFNIKLKSTKNKTTRKRAQNRARFVCPECGRTTKSQIGLYSHRRTHL